jgi:glutamate/tyrosine decarboxylase-like PLP-dependent enzyme
MSAEALDAAVQGDRSKGLLPWLVVAAAGATDTGAVDPLADIAAVARAHRLWLHVDGAYGAMFALCEEGKRILRGIEQSDSLTLDPHKGLFMPCGSGAILIRSGQALLNAFGYSAAYMQDRTALASLAEVSPSELSPELTRPFRGLRLWLSLKLLGVGPFRAALEEKLLLARHFHERVQNIQGIEAGPAPDLSVVVFRFVPKVGDADEFNRRLLAAVQRDGRVFLTSTRLGEKVWLRLAILCAGTHLEHVEMALESLAARAKAMESGAS